MKNTKSAGIMRYICFIENGIFYGVCLDFDIVVNGSSNEEVREKIIEVSKDHLRTVVNNNLDDSLLNRHAPKEYWDMYEKFQAKSSTTTHPVLNKKRPVLSSYMQSYPMLVTA